VLPALRAVAGFEAAPLWDGAPVETGALARMRAHPLVASVAKRCGNSVPARMAARLVELAALLARLAGTADAAAAPGICAFPLGPGEGLAAVQTARGLLLHHARVAEGRVAGYRIVAPTEWNFHPDGPLARGLAGLAAANDAALERSARLAAQALDPCVACRIEVAHA
jgi:coenzyme F420-reducing hydrogenase alpha subunit